MKDMILGFFMLIGISTATFGEIPQDRINQLTKTLSADIYSEFNSLQDSQTEDSSNDEFYPIAHKYVNTEKIKVVLKSDVLSTYLSYLDYISIKTYVIQLHDFLSSSKSLKFSL